ncbi:MAG: glycosyltransferase [Methylococcaceae bacterium]|jgi:glycosyltransferase involved in cell wall biosynthesis
MKMKKILWLSSSYPRFEADTASIFLRYLAVALQKKQFEIHVLSPDNICVDPQFQTGIVQSHRYMYFWPRKLQKLAYGSGILPNLRNQPWLFVQIPFFMLAMFVSAWRLIQRLKPDVIHAHWVFPQGVLASLLGKLTGVPVIITAHGGDVFALQGRVLGYLKRWGIQHCRAWTCNTLATAKAVGHYLPTPEIIPMGVDYALFSSGQPISRSVTGKIILFVGRLVEKKGVHCLITAFSLLPKAELETAKLWIIGDGLERKRLEDLVVALGLTENVVFYGRLANTVLPQYYAAADIFVAPSMPDASGDTEGQGVMLLEAMACGVAVISTKTGGITEVLDDGRSALLVPPNDPVALKNAIGKLLEDSELRAFLAKTGQKQAQRYDWEHVALKFALLYRAVLNA